MLSRLINLFTSTMQFIVDATNATSTWFGAILNAFLQLFRWAKGLSYGLSGLFGIAGYAGINYSLKHSIGSLQFGQGQIDKFGEAWTRANGLLNAVAVWLPRMNAVLPIDTLLFTVSVFLAFCIFVWSLRKLQGAVDKAAAAGAAMAL